MMVYLIISQYISCGVPRESIDGIFSSEEKAKKELEEMGYVYSAENDEYYYEDESNVTTFAKIFPREVE